MGFTPFEFDESVGQTDPGRPHVSEGFYKMKAIKIEPTPRDYEKTTGVYLTAQFVEGPEANPAEGVGRELRDYSALGGRPTKDGRGTQFGLGQTLGAFGLASVAKKMAERNPDGSAKVRIDTYEAFERLCENLTRAIAGKEAVALIGDQPSTTGGRPFSGVEEWQSADQWPTLKRAHVGNPMLGPRVGAGAPPASVTNGQVPAPVVASVASEVDALFN